MKLAIGQRWRFKNITYDYVAEVTELNPVRVKILQIKNSIYDLGAYIFPESLSENGSIVKDIYYNDLWIYLEGQDK
jgi:hypothetical protein